jgi:hypothetical protein
VGAYQTSVSPSIVSAKPRVININGPSPASRSETPSFKQSVFSVAKQKKKKSPRYHQTQHIKVMDQIKIISQIKDDLVQEGDFHYDVQKLS